MATWATTRASAALTPRSGNAPACGGHARVGDVDRLRGEDLRQQLVARPGMDHQRAVHAFEHARVEQH